MTELEKVFEKNKKEIEEAVAQVRKLKEEIKKRMPNVWHVMKEKDVQELTRGVIPIMWIKKYRAQDRKKKGWA